MARPVDHRDLAAAGYFTEWSRKPGQVATFHLSSRDATPKLSVCRLDRPGVPPVDWPIRTSGAVAKPQSLALGSWLELPVAGVLGPDWLIRFEFRLTAPPEGRVLLSVDGLDRPLAPLPVHHWLTATETPEAGSRTRMLRITDSDGSVLMERTLAGPISPLRAIRIGRGAEDDAPTLNVMIGRIRLGDTEGAAFAWCFPVVGRPRNLEPADAKGRGPTLIVHNAPGFAMRSPRWDGSVLDPRLDPTQYDAVALHDDDLVDANWPATHFVDIPEQAESGIYAIAVDADGETSRWPLFITPGLRQADLVFLAPTLTYLAYANERLPPDRFPWLCDDAGHRFARANRLTSLYDNHDDASGVALAGFRRPLATVRDDYRYPLCGAPHLLPVDLRLLHFLRAEGIEVDVITDLELHREGEAALDGYRGLMTGSHPEYWTGGMLDATTAFRDRGGHIAYLGGNGCYWVTGCEGDTIEVRRGLSGIRTWSSQPGETHLAMTGEPGGLWRHRGRAEHALLGTGLAAMGFTGARAFHRTAASHQAEYAWLFAGVADGPIGTTGSVLGGAAGYEIDARHARWGSPAHAVVLAVADGFNAGYVADPDSVEADQPAILQAELVLTEHPSGALIFAASSVCWCGSLPDPGASNSVGSITRNLLRRFLR